MGVIGANKRQAASRFHSHHCIDTEKKSATNRQEDSTYLERGSKHGVRTFSRRWWIRNNSLIDVFLGVQLVILRWGQRKRANTLPFRSRHLVFDVRRSQGLKGRFPYFTAGQHHHGQLKMAAAASTVRAIVQQCLSAKLQVQPASQEQDAQWVEVSIDLRSCNLFRPEKNGVFKIHSAFVSPGVITRREATAGRGLETSGTNVRVCRVRFRHMSRPEIVLTEVAT